MTSPGVVEVQWCEDSESKTRSHGPDKAGPGPAVLEMVITSQRQVGGSTASGEERCSSGHHNHVYICVFSTSQLSSYEL